MTELATLALVLVTLAVGGLAFAVGIVLVRRVMGQWNAERHPTTVERVTDAIDTATGTGTVAGEDGPRRGAV